jgi:hypothetical protein
MGYRRSTPSLLLWFGFELYPQGSCDIDSVASWWSFWEVTGSWGFWFHDGLIHWWIHNLMTLLGGGGNFQRWGLVGGSMSLRAGNVGGISCSQPLPLCLFLLPACHKVSCFAPPCPLCYDILPCHRDEVKLPWTKHLKLWTKVNHSSFNLLFSGFFLWQWQKKWLIYSLPLGHWNWFNCPQFLIALNLFLSA